MGVKEEIRPIGPSFTQTLAILTQLTVGQMIPSGVVRGLSNLHASQVMIAAPVWASLEVEVRRDVLSALIEASLSDFEADFGLFGILALDDDDADVRRKAVELCAHTEESGYMGTLFEVAQNDEAMEVRIAALRALGHYVLEGELGHLADGATAPIIEYMFGLLADARIDSEERAPALEAVGYVSNRQAEAEISRAYHGDDGRMKTAAIFAMGASGDERWAEQIVRELQRGSAENRFEAARAAGELSLQEAVRPLSELVFGEDGEIAREAIWALGEIGGKEAVRVLEALLDQVESSEDDDLFDLVEDALDNANASAGYVFGFDSPDEMLN